MTQLFNLRFTRGITNLLLMSLGFGGAASAQITVTVNATMDLYRAGNYDGGSDGTAPAYYSFPARTGQVLTFAAVNGFWSCSSQAATYGPDGTSDSPCFPMASVAQPVGPFSGYRLTDFSGALAGVFLEDGLPASAPDPLRFYASNNALGGIRTDFRSLSPKIGQVFFIGDGLTGTQTGDNQTFNVPSTATKLYLGFVRTCRLLGNSQPGCYVSATGAVAATFQFQRFTLDWLHRMPATSPGPRVPVSMTFDAARGVTLLFGGGTSTGTGVLNDTWVWRSGWKQLFPANAPSPRTWAAMAYDPTTRTVVLFGGADAHSRVYGDTWLWDGSNWTQQFPAVSPPARANLAMVYNPATRTVLMFGGGGDGNGDYGGIPFGDTWEWDGRTKTWTQRFPASSPSPRITSIAYDPVAQNVVLFGGEDDGGDCCRVFYNDTWTWNGDNWIQRFPPNSPSKRSGFDMTYDAALGATIVFGGTSGPPTALNDTWAWNGQTWTKLNLPHAPGQRYLPGLSYDPLTRGVILFGGQLAGNIVTNDTWTLGPVPVP